ncbi:MAG: LLM class F420-dependent oxidoreductase [Rhizobiaceae bacterium]
MASAGSKIKIGFHLGPQHGEYRRMRDQWLAAEELGVDALYSADHFFAQSIEIDAGKGERPPSKPGANFEGMTIQAAMAATTTRPEIGCIVHAIGYRNPHLMADMARTIDHISGGRFILGLGSGYLEQDYLEYGYAWTSQKERSLELAAKIPIIKDRLEQLEPPPLRRMPLLIGAMGEKIGIPTVARHADIWHVYGTAEVVAAKIERLKECCAEIGRPFEEIELATWYLPGIMGISNSPDDILALGIRNLINLQAGPDWDLGIIRELIAWRDNLA